MKEKKSRISIQKVFCFISFIFIITCCFWYGGRAIYYYLDSHKSVEKESILARKIVKSEKNLKRISNDYYFYKKNDNNYLMYSNILFRIIKITKNNEITIVSEKPITYLANGNKKNYINKWLNITNDEDTGILQSNLNGVTKYLIKNKTCIDDVSDIKKVTCNKMNKDYFISPLSIIDYLNTGGKDSFINNGYYTYLANSNNEKIWYVDDEGSLDSNDGDEIYGIKFTLTLSPTTTIEKGNGTSDSPYIIEKENSYFASYVKLGDDLWRVYQKDRDELKLSLTHYLQYNNKDIEYLYSNNTYFHNDTKKDSLAYYLNNNYLNRLSYKDIIINSNYSNNMYNEDNNYDYKEVLNKTVDTKVANLSIGNIFLTDLDNYYIATGKTKTTMYVTKKNFTVDYADVSEEKYIIPCITIKKESLTAGSGTKEDPYRTE